MANSTPPRMWAAAIEQDRFEIGRLFQVEGRSSQQVKSALEEKHLGPNRKISSHQWKYILRKHNIHKNLCANEVMIIMGDLGSDSYIFQHLIFADGVLVDSNNVKHYCERPNESSGWKNAKPRTITYLHLPFTFSKLNDPLVFQSFRRLLFHTRNHFERSFHDRTWDADERGLYARGPERRAELMRLSDLHNKVVDALNRFEAGEMQTGWALIGNAFEHNEEIVQSHHHRQFSDILAILLLLQRNPYTIPVYHFLANNLWSFAEQRLQPEDTRMVFFKSLPDLSLDTTGHLFLTFDAYCRDLWKLHTGVNEIKSLWSYNQASFPRADPGHFYDLFKGKRPETIQLELDQIDKELHRYSHEAFNLWHTAAHWFRQEKKFGDMEYVLQHLCDRVYELGNGYDYSEKRQLNFDCMMSLSLLGGVLERQGDLDNAMTTFEKALEIRSQNVSGDRWCPGKAGALRRLESIAMRLGDLERARSCNAHLKRMYVAQERQDRQREGLI